MASNKYSDTALYDLSIYPPMDDSTIHVLIMWVEYEVKFQHTYEMSSPMRHTVGLTFDYLTSTTSSCASALVDVIQTGLYWRKARWCESMNHHDAWHQHILRVVAMPISIMIHDCTMPVSCPFGLGHFSLLFSALLK